MSEETFSKVMRGYDTQAVDSRMGELEAEIASIYVQLGEATAVNTSLRLSMVKQVEEASAEAAVVLGHGRSEATRIRSAATNQSAEILEQAELSANSLVQDATEAKAEALAEKAHTKASAEEIIALAGRDASAIVAKSQARADQLERDAQATRDEATKRAQDKDGQLRLQKTQLDRQEAEVRDQADAYAMRVYREADQYSKAAEQRAVDLEKQAEEVLMHARRAAHDTTSRAISNARKHLEDSLGLVNTIFSDVNGSLSDVSRIRQVLTDQVERLSVREPAAQEITDVSAPRTSESAKINELADLSRSMTDVSGLEHAVMHQGEDVPLAEPEVPQTADVSGFVTDSSDREPAVMDQGEGVPLAEPQVPQPADVAAFVTDSSDLEQVLIDQGEGVTPEEPEVQETPEVIEPRTRAWFKANGPVGGGKAR